jgi:hypothetical protein
LGLRIGRHRGQRWYSHTGGDIAHRTYFGYYPELRGGVILMSNHTGFRTGLGIEVAEAFFADAFEAEEEEGSPDQSKGLAAEVEGPTLEHLEAIAGNWIIEVPGSSLPFVLTVEDGNLHGQAAGQNKFPLRATSDSTFTHDRVGASFTFHWNENGTVDRGMLHQTGDRPMRRVEAEEEPLVLEDYVGRYYCGELETFYDVFLEEGELKVKGFWLATVGLNHRDGDDFTGSQDFFRAVAFERAQNGSVTGFTVSSGRVKDLFFQRYY